MKKEFSTKWKASTQPRKQRKYRINAPLHTKAKFLHAPVSKELAKKHNIKKIGVVQGDKVKIMKGSFRGKEGKVDVVSLRKGKVTITGIELTKKDGSKSRPMICASNLLITELKLDDKLRFIQKKPEKKTDVKPKINNKNQ